MGVGLVSESGGCCPSSGITAMPSAAFGCSGPLGRRAARQRPRAACGSFRAWPAPCAPRAARHCPAGPAPNRPFEWPCPRAPDPTGLDTHRAQGAGAGAPVRDAVRLALRGVGGGDGKGGLEAGHHQHRCQISQPGLLADGLGRSRGRTGRPKAAASGTESASVSKNDTRAFDAQRNGALPPAYRAGCRAFSPALQRAAVRTAKAASSISVRTSSGRCMRQCLVQKRSRRSWCGNRRRL